MKNKSLAKKIDGQIEFKGSFEISKREKELLTSLGNYFQACNTHGGGYMFVSGPMSNEVVRKNHQAAQMISDEHERLDRESGVSGAGIVYD